MMRLLAILLNWRTPEMTLKAAEAARVALRGLDAELSIVDNDSGDGSFERLSAATADWPGTRVLQSGRNGGFGAGNNYGLRAGRRDGQRPDLCYILNSDAFPAQSAIRALVTHLQTHPEAGLAGSYIHGTDGAPHLTTFRFPSIASEFEGAARTGPVSCLLAARAVPIPVPEASRPVDWLAGASLMIRTDVLDRIGLFDEAFFLYFEETDLCLRAARAGWQTHFVRESAVAHEGSASTGMKDWARTPGYWFDSRLHYFVKNHGAPYAAAATAAHVAGGLIHRARCLVTGRRPADPPRFLSTLLAHDLRAALPGAARRAVHEPRLTGV